MKRIGGAVSFVLSFGLLAIACGGGSGGADPASVAKELKSPSGTLEPTKSGDLANDATTQQESTAEYGAVFSLMGGGGAMSGKVDALAAKNVMIQSVKPLATTDFGGGITCDTANASGGGNSASVNCTCDGGGSAKIEVKGEGLDSQTGPSSLDYKMSFSACKAGEVIVDGSFHFYTDLPKGIADTTDQTIVYTGSFTYQEGTSAPKSIEFGFGMLQNKIYYLVKTPEGTFSVSASPWNRETKTGTVYIKDKDGDHTCQVENGTATCTAGITAG